MIDAQAITERAKAVQAHVTERDKPMALSVDGLKTFAGSAIDKAAVSEKHSNIMMVGLCLLVMTLFTGFVLFAAYKLSNSVIEKGVVVESVDLRNTRENRRLEFQREWLDVITEIRAQAVDANALRTETLSRMAALDANIRLLSNTIEAREAQINTGIEAAVENRIQTFLSEINQRPLEKRPGE